jgi:Phosphopantetheinyl transferase
MNNSKIYTFEKGSNHTRELTDQYIQDSAKSYLEECGMTDDISVIHDSRGKPVIESRAKIFASATHTDNIVVVAVSENEIGIDCEEKSRDIKNIERLAKGFFTPSEFLKLDGLCGDERRLSFLKIWVKKESYVKLTGIGLSGIKQVDVFSLPENIVFTDTDIGDNYFVSVCENISMTH